MEQPSAADIYGRDFPAGAVIFEEGDPGTRVYIIQRGRVRIEKRAGTRRVVLATLAPGDFFGEMALLEGQPRLAAAVVEEPARVLELDQEAFDGMVRTNGEVGLRLLRRLSGRLRAADRRIRNFLAADVMARAVEVLTALAGPTGADGLRLLPPDLGPEELGRRAGENPAAAGALWVRMSRVGLLRERDGAAALAPEAEVAEFLRYVELKPRYDALAAGEFSEVEALADDLERDLLHRLLDADGSIQGEVLAEEYREYLRLQHRFGVPAGEP